MARRCISGIGEIGHLAISVLDVGTLASDMHQLILECMERGGDRSLQPVENCKAVDGIRIFGH